MGFPTVAATSLACDVGVRLVGGLRWTLAEIWPRTAIVYNLGVPETLLNTLLEVLDASYGYVERALTTFSKLRSVLGVLLENGVIRVWHNLDCFDE